MNLENYLQDKFKLYDSLHKFNILLDIQGTPCARVAINGIVTFDDKLTTGSVCIDTEQNLDKHASGSISIEMYNKTNRDTIVQNGEIVSDVTLGITDIFINGVSLSKTGHIHRGVYTPQYWEDYKGDKPKTITGARVMGFNGVWKYSWSASPIRDIINHFHGTQDKIIKQDISEIFDAMDIKL